MIYIVLIRLFHDVNRQNRDKDMKSGNSNFSHDLPPFDMVVATFSEAFCSPSIPSFPFSSSAPIIALRGDRQALFEH
jgi:hypothetical protein